MRAAGIEYVHLGALGVPASARQALQSEADYTAIFQHYRTVLLPAQPGALAELAALVHQHGHVALTCFEADPAHCHRHVLAEVLVREHLQAVAVVHVAAES